MIRTFGAVGLRGKGPLGVRLSACDGGKSIIPLGAVSLTLPCLHLGRG